MNEAFMAAAVACYVFPNYYPLYFFLPFYFTHVFFFNHFDSGGFIIAFLFFYSSFLSFHFFLSLLTGTFVGLISISFVSFFLFFHPFYYQARRATETKKKNRDRELESESESVGEEEEEWKDDEEEEGCMCRQRRADSRLVIKLTTRNSTITQKKRCLKVYMRRLM